MRNARFLIAANVAAVVFLGLVAFGVFRVPQDDCSAIQARVSELSRELSSLKQDLTKRLEVSNPAVSKDDLERVLDSLIILGDRVHAVEQRLVELEARLEFGAELPHAMDLHTASLDDLLAEPIKLDKRARTLASRFAPDVFCTQTVEQMMDNLLASEIIDKKSKDAVPPEFKTELYRLAAGLKADYLIIQLKQDCWVEEQVERALDSGNYLEAREPVPLTIPPDGGIGVGRIGPDGVRRLFQFSAEEHPELTKFSLLEERAKDRFFQSAQDLCRKHGIEAEVPEPQEVPDKGEKQTE